MINPAIENDLKNMSLNDVNYADYIKENYVPIEVLQEIRQEIEKLKITISLSKACFTKDQIDTYRAAANNALFIIDKHISDIEERATDDLTKKQEEILTEAEEWDSETMSGDLYNQEEIKNLLSDIGGTE